MNHHAHCHIYLNNILASVHLAAVANLHKINLVIQTLFCILKLLTRRHPERHIYLRHMTACCERLPFGCKRHQHAAPLI